MWILWIGWAACGVLLSYAERAELCLTAAVALIWTVLAPLYRAADRARAALVLACAATPFLGLAVSSDVAAGAPLAAVFVVAVIGLVWSIALACVAATGWRNGNYERFVLVWLLVALCLPALALALGLVGEGARVPQWLTAMSPPAWLLGRSSLAAWPGWLDFSRSAGVASLGVAASALALLRWHASERGAFDAR